MPEPNGSRSETGKRVLAGEPEDAAPSKRPRPSAVDDIEAVAKRTKISAEQEPADDVVVIDDTASGAIVIDDD